MLKFFLNSSTEGYLRNLEAEFGDSTNSIRLELNKFEKAGMLVSFFEGNKKIFKANTEHPLFPEIHNLVKKYVGLDKILEQVVSRVGDLKAAYLIGDYANGIDSGEMEILLIGDRLNVKYIEKLSFKIKELIHREVKYTIMIPTDFQLFRDRLHNYLIIWQVNNDN